VTNGFLPLTAAVPCGLIVNELISNALKYAFPVNGPGEIRIELNREATGEAVLLVSDNGIGIPANLVLEHVATFGLQLVTLLSEQLGGELTIQRSTPTRFVLRFAL
jgi:two-component sensor histidine kinase